MSKFFDNYYLKPYLSDFKNDSIPSSPLLVKNYITYFILYYIIKIM